MLRYWVPTSKANEETVAKLVLELFYFKSVVGGSKGERLLRLVLGGEIVKEPYWRISSYSLFAVFWLLSLLKVCLICIMQSSFSLSICCRLPLSLLPSLHISAMRSDLPVTESCWVLFETPFSSHAESYSSSTTTGNDFLPGRILGTTLGEAAAEFGSSHIARAKSSSVVCPTEQLVRQLNMSSASLQPKWEPQNVLRATLVSRLGFVRPFSARSTFVPATSSRADIISVARKWALPTRSERSTLTIPSSKEPVSCSLHHGRDLNVRNARNRTIHLVSSQLRTLSSACHPTQFLKREVPPSALFQFSGHETSRPMSSELHPAFQIV